MQIYILWQKKRKLISTVFTFRSSDLEGSDYAKRDYNGKMSLYWRVVDNEEIEVVMKVKGTRLGHCEDKLGF